MNEDCIWLFHILQSKHNHPDRLCLCCYHTNIHAWRVPVFCWNVHKVLFPVSTLHEKMCQTKVPVVQQCWMTSQLPVQTNTDWGFSFLKGQNQTTSTRSTEEAVVMKVCRNNLSRLKRRILNVMKIKCEMKFQKLWNSFHCRFSFILSLQRLHQVSAEIMNEVIFTSKMTIFRCSGSVLMGFVSIKQKDKNTIILGSPRSWGGEWVGSAEGFIYKTVMVSG